MTTTPKHDDRDLTGSQRALAGARLAKTLAPDGTRGKSAEKAAKTVGSTTRQVERAMTIIDHGVPELQQAVEQGVVSLSDAATITKSSAETQEKALQAVKKREARTLVDAAKRQLADAGHQRAFDDRQIERLISKLATLLNERAKVHRLDGHYDTLTECLQRHRPNQDQSDTGDPAPMRTKTRECDLCGAPITGEGNWCKRCRDEFNAATGGGG